MHELEDQSPRAVGKRVRRAASRGPVPADPDEREAAHEVVLDHLRVFDRQRWWAPALFVAMAVVAAGVALTGPAWVWVVVPLLLAAAVGHPRLRAHLRRREALLAPDGPRPDWRRSGGSPAACGGTAAPMNIDKNQILELLRSQGDDSKAQQADQELPDQVDTDKDAGLLSKFGIDPMELIKKFGGGKLGGLLG